MKSVLISVQPKWCELIANGKKTVEIRKSRPKIGTPFKCYIYCTKPKGKYDYGLCIDRGVCGTLKSVGLLAKCNYEFAVKNEMPILSGKVIGEFLCDHIIIAEQQNRVKREKILEYANGNEVYGWHISDLVIYDKPKELSEFYVLDEKAIKECKHRERVYVNPDSVNGAWLKGSYICTKGEEDWCSKCKTKPLKRPPQSWCYVEGVEGK